MKIRRERIEQWRAEKKKKQLLATKELIDKDSIACKYGAIFLCSKY